MVAGQPVHLKDEVILEEEEADDGEEVDQDEGQQGGQKDGAAVSGHTLDDVEQCLFAVDEVKELWGRNEDTAGPTGCLLPAGSHVPPETSALRRVEPDPQAHFGRHLWGAWSPKAQEEGAQGKA